MRVGSHTRAVVPLCNSQQYSDNESSKHDEIHNDIETFDEVVVVARPCASEAIDLIYQVMDVNTIDVNGECSVEIPSAVATPLHLSEARPVVSSTTSPSTTPSSCAFFLALTDQRNRVPSAVGVRPEFIFASTLFSGDKDTIMEDIGLVLEPRTKGGVHVAVIRQESPFLGGNIQPGDHVIAINHILCADYSLERVRELIEASVQNKDKKVSICVHNPRGDSSLVSSSIVKPQPDTKVGITLRRRNDVIRIKEMSEHSLFADTLMTPQQRCRSINGVPCDHMTAHSASALIGYATSRVTIVSEIQECCAVSIGVHEQVGWWQKVALGVASAMIGNFGPSCVEASLEH